MNFAIISFKNNQFFHKYILIYLETLCLYILIYFVYISSNSNKTKKGQSEPKLTKHGHPGQMGKKTGGKRGPNSVTQGPTRPNGAEQGKMGETRAKQTKGKTEQNSEKQE